MVLCSPFFRGFMYAIIEAGTKKYRVAAGETLVIDRIEAEPGQPFTFEKVLFVSNDGKHSVGAPTIAQASVLADVVEHRRGPKVIAFKMKRRKGYHRTVGHRQEQTVLKIKEIKA
jgi:large subunit ribosomal protein L21